MLGIGFGEMLIIAVVVLIAVGPKKMPTFMKAVGKGMREFRRATRELKNATGIEELLRDDDLRNPLKSKPKPRPVYKLSESDLRMERPPAGVDIAHAADHPESARAFRPPPPEEAEVPEAFRPMLEGHEPAAAMPAGPIAEDVTKNVAEKIPHGPAPTKVPGVTGGKLPPKARPEKPAAEPASSEEKPEAKAAPEAKPVPEPVGVGSSGSGGTEGS